MLKKKISSKELAQKIGITPANLSILKTGKAKGIRFVTLEKICEVLDCQPGDILEYQREESKDMKKTVYEQVFELVDAMYNSIVEESDFDPEVIKVLMTAGKYLNEKKMPPQVIAAKTVNEIILANMSNKSKLDQINSDRLNQLLMLSRSEGYKWSSVGPTDLRVQF
ncbi:hypothetical protein FD33_GL001015 [Companilactobacillus paralimentarius DSM 13238 = JCM 10415]|uniref:HTH cro/C1-type domain-containing protein n=1 Tax=Companilactobacillus paralimentarius DSM 13238 = JCM 10415 TaxID=1122151 RepID=A0A0R1PAJ7_9LACO|nr:hypothetical protein FD33_GL001015 [Companilactobacillus paralimentarius DSM 13238 = JCM 10415]